MMSEHSIGLMKQGNYKILKGVITMEILAMGYSALHGVKMLVHTRQAHDPCEVEDASHPGVPPCAPSMHVLHYGRGHDDGRIKITNAQPLNGLQPAWEQPVASAVFANQAAQNQNASTMPACQMSHTSHPGWVRQNKRPQGTSSSWPLDNVHFSGAL